MAVTEEEQIEAEIAAIFGVRPVSDNDILERLEVGKEILSEVFFFAQYRGFALYDGALANFKMTWDEKDGTPPLSRWLRVTRQQDGMFLVGIVEDKNDCREPAMPQDFDWANVI